MFNGIVCQQRSGVIDSSETSRLASSCTSEYWEYGELVEHRCPTGNRAGLTKGERLRSGPGNRKKGGIGISTVV